MTSQKRPSQNRPSQNRPSPFPAASRQDSARAAFLDIRSPHRSRARRAVAPGKHAQRVALLLLPLILGACLNPPPTHEPNDLIPTAFQDPLRFDVARINRRDLSHTPANDVSHLAPEPPRRLLARWADDNLKAQGHQGSLAFVITTAAFTRETQVQSAFLPAGAERYRVELAADIIWLDDFGIEKARTQVQAISQGQAEDTTGIAKRHRLWRRLLRQALRDFHREAHIAVQRFLPIAVR